MESLRNMTGMVKNCMQLKYDFNFRVNCPDHSEESEINFRFFIIQNIFRTLKV